MPGMPYGMGMPQYGGPGQSSFPSPRGPGGAFPYPGAGGQYSPRGSPILSCALGLIVHYFLNLSFSLNHHL